MNLSCLQCFTLRHDRGNTDDEQKRPGDLRLNDSDSLSWEQFIYLSPDKNLVIVMTSEPYGGLEIATLLEGEGEFLPIVEAIVEAIVD